MQCSIMAEDLFRTRSTILQCSFKPGSWLDAVLLSAGSKLAVSFLKTGLRHTENSFNYGPRLAEAMLRTNSRLAPNSFNYVPRVD